MPSQKSMLTPEVIAAITAHNTRKPDPVYNDNWNRQYKTGTVRARSLVRAALSFRYGICDGPMSRKHVTKQDVADWVLYRADAAINAWAVEQKHALEVVTNA